MKITYFGHACFLLESREGKRILIDPFHPQVGYPVPRVNADLVLVSHEHSDHNYVEMAKGSPRVVRGLRDGGREHAEVRETVEGVRVVAIPTYHDGAHGAQRGKNAMFRIEVDALKILHCGDLGHDLEGANFHEGAYKGALKPDILMVPVGGHFTIDARTAELVVNRLQPRVVIPMHYRTEANPTWPLAPVDEFLAGKRNVTRVGHRVEATPLPSYREIWVMDWKEKTP